METITIPKEEYIQLKKIADAYKQIASNVFQNINQDSIDDIIKDFKDTDLYSDEFIDDLKNGLEKSSYLNDK